MSQSTKEVLALMLMCIAAVGLLVYATQSDSAEFSIEAACDLTFQEVGEVYVVSGECPITLDLEQQMPPVEWLHEPARHRTSSPLQGFVRNVEVYRGSYEDSPITGTWLQQPRSYYD